MRHLFLCALVALAVTAQAASISTNFTSAVAGPSAELVVNTPALTGTYTLTGTFSATMQLQYSQDGNSGWSTLASYTTTQTAVVIAIPGFYRWNCSAYTSGTAVGAINSGYRIYQKQLNNAGQLIFQVDDSGVFASNAPTPSGGQIGANFQGNVNNYFEVQVQNNNAGTSASSDFVATADNGTATTHYVNLGINSSTGGSAPFTAANEAYVYSSDNVLDIAAIGATGTVNVAVGATPKTLLNVDVTNGVTINDQTTVSKQLRFLNSGATASTVLTLAGQQSTSQTLSVPNITGADTLATLGLPQTFSAVNTFGSATAATSTATGAVVVSGASAGLGVAGAVFANQGNFGGGAADANSVLRIGGIGPLAGSTQRGVAAVFAGSSAATTQINGYDSRPSTAAASFTCAQMNDYFAVAQSLGAGSAVTNQMMYYAQFPSNATNNAAFYAGSSVTGPVGNWGLYIDGAFKNYLGTAATLINTTTDDAVNKLQVNGGSALNGAVVSTLSDAATNTVVPQYTTTKNSSGTPAAGFGVSSIWQLQDSTTAAIAAALQSVEWIVATHGSTTARMKLAVDNAGTAREGLRIDATATDAFCTIGGASLPSTSFTGNVIWGVRSGAADTVGAVGEVIQGTNQSTYTNYTTTNTLQQVAVLTSLPAGRWKIVATGTYFGNAATVAALADCQWAISTSTASTTGGVEGRSIGYVTEAITSSLHDTITLSTDVNISAATSYFWNSKALFTAGNPQFVGSLTAYRLR